MDAGKEMIDNNRVNIRERETGGLKSKCVTVRQAEMKEGDVANESESVKPSVTFTL